MKAYPIGSDNYGWHLHYVKRFNKTGNPDAAHLAMWYLFLHYLHNPESLPCD